MIVIIDNYDSFTYNLVQCLQALGLEVHVELNDQISLAQLIQLKPTHLLISPGPGTPESAGISNAAISYFAGRIPVLGVCLGHQCLASLFGAELKRDPALMHGKTSMIYHHKTSLFHDLPSPFQAMRYHSWIVERQYLPDDFVVTAETSSHAIMGLQHQPTGAIGVQFHPESILTEVGPLFMENFCRC